MLNPDFRDMLSAFAAEDVEFLVLTSIDGVTFDTAWANREEIEVEGLELPVLGRTDFITNKRALGRPQDLADVARLEQEGS